MLNLCGIVVAILKMAAGRNFSMNGHHNTAKIQHCSISKVAFNLFFKPVACGRFGRLHNR
jgi:formate/nitrite transporter FocA (FNT family)